MTDISPNRRHDAPTPYEITVLGRLDDTWSGWFGDLTLTTDVCETNEPVTRLRGLVTDQAELYGILGKINDLGLLLLSVKRIAPAREPEQR